MWFKTKILGHCYGLFQQSFSFQWVARSIFEYLQRFLWTVQNTAQGRSA